MRANKDRFVCWLPCKPYVKQYLLANFNAPDDNWNEIVNLSADKDLHADFIARLGKNGRWDRKYKTLAKYVANVPIEIKKDEFYRYGWSLSNTDVIRFGVKVERRIKQMLFLYLDTNVCMGLPLSAAIRNFQHLFGYDDDSWSYETIRREYNRHSGKKNANNETIFEYIDKIIMGKLYEFGTISQKGKSAYENNQVRDRQSGGIASSVCDSSDILRSNPEGLCQQYSPVRNHEQ